MRAVSILFVGINVYWFCYSTLKEWGVTFEVIDKILWNFQRTTGLFSSILWTKLFSVVFLALSCIGTKGVKEEKITWTKIHCSLAHGCSAVLPELVDAGTSSATYGRYGVLHHHAISGLYLYAYGGHVDVPPVEKQPHG